MQTYFPKYFTSKAIAVYFVALVVVTVLYSNYAMKWYWFIFGAVAIIGFFYGSNLLTQSWGRYSTKSFVKRLFWTAFIIRTIYAVFAYVFFDAMTGQPFMFQAADELMYQDMALYGSASIRAGHLFFASDFTSWGLDFSDSGYGTYLGYVYYLIGDSLLLSHILKAVWSAWLCVLIYKLAARNFGESTGRMAAIFCLLMPNLIYYCGMHLKEMEMTFISVLFVERADAMLREKKLSVGSMLISLLIGTALFAFRTALGAVALIALFVALVFTSAKVLALWKKIVISIATIACLGLTVGEQIRQEAEDLWQNKDTNQEASLQWRAEREGGNSLASKASAAVFAPLIFTIPFPTIVETEGQENQRMIHGGNYVKNITSFFTISALILLLMSGNWRKHVLPIAFMCGYLLVIAFSAFAQSERFHMPALPFALMFAAYGISQMQNKYKRWYIFWLLFIFAALIGWSWFKLKGRGVI